MPACVCLGADLTTWLDIYFRKHLCSLGQKTVGWLARMPVQLTQVRHDETHIKVMPVGTEKEAMLHRGDTESGSKRKGEIYGRSRDIWLGLVEPRSTLPCHLLGEGCFPASLSPRVPSSSCNTRAKTDHQPLNRPFIPIFNRINIFKLFQNKFWNSST